MMMTQKVGGSCGALEQRNLTTSENYHSSPLEQGLTNIEIIVQIELKKSEEKQIPDVGRKKDQNLVKALNTAKSQLHPYGHPPPQMQMRFWLQLLQYADFLKSD